MNMTKEQTKQAIKVMQAWVDGEHIQGRVIGKTEWGDYDGGWNPKWDWDGGEYRVKPKPMEIEVWMNKYNPGHPLRIVDSNDGYMISDGYQKKTFIEKV